MGCSCGCNKPRDEGGDVRDAVRKGYAQIANEGVSPRKSCCGGGGSPEALAKSIGYAEEDLAALPEGANMGLSCGNPTALASLKPGEVVLDLGSGGGFDVFLAARRVGPKGTAIGVDMTPEMLQKARRNAKRHVESTGVDNVEFRLGEIEHLPAADASADVVISNCVINLSPEKAQVWREIARVLKPGGRAAVSDLALLRPLPEAVRESVSALVGCVAGAILVEETREQVRAAGLVEATFEARPGYVESMTAWSDPLYQEIAEKLPEGVKISDYVTSLSITAYKLNG